jgi:flagellar motor component MotA
VDEWSEALKDLFRDLQSALLEDGGKGAIQKAGQLHDILKEDERLVGYSPFFSRADTDPSQNIQDVEAILSALRSSLLLVMRQKFYRPEAELDLLPRIVEVWNELQCEINNMLLVGCPRWTKRLLDTDDVREFFRCLKPPGTDPIEIEREVSDRLSVVLEVVKSGSIFRGQDLLVGAARCLAAEKRYVAAFLKSSTWAQVNRSLVSLWNTAAVPPYLKEIFPISDPQDGDSPRIVDLINQTVGLCETALREGLLALEDLVEDISVALLRTGVELAIAGTDPELIHSILKSKADTLLYTFRRRADMIRTGVLSVQAGDNPKIVETKLLSYMEKVRATEVRDKIVGDDMSAAGGGLDEDQSATSDNGASFVDAYKDGIDLLAGEDERSLKTSDTEDLVEALVFFSERARREGLLALEDDMDAIEDPTLLLGIQLVIDGTDPEIIREVLIDVASRQYEELETEFRVAMFGVSLICSAIPIETVKTSLASLVPFYAYLDSGRRMTVETAKLLEAFEALRKDQDIQAIPEACRPEALIGRIPFGTPDYLLNNRDLPQYLRNYCDIEAMFFELKVLLSLFARAKDHQLIPGKYIEIIRDRFNELKERVAVTLTNLSEGKSGSIPVEQEKDEALHELLRSGQSILEQNRHFEIEAESLRSELEAMIDSLVEKLTIHEARVKPSFDNLRYVVEEETINRFLAELIRLSHERRESYKELRARKLEESRNRIEELAKEILDLSLEVEKSGGEDIELELVRKVIMRGAGDFRKVRDLVSTEVGGDIMAAIFLFEDIAKLEDRSVQKILRELDSAKLAQALKGASKEVQDKFFRNMSERAVNLLKEDMEFLGPVKIEDVKNAQQHIANIAYKLSELGEITL